MVSLTLAVAVFATIVTMCFMGSYIFIVTHHPALANDEYKISIWCVVQDLLMYIVISIVYTRWMRKKKVFALWVFLGFPHSLEREKLIRATKVGGFIGFLWAVNNVCIMVAGKYIPNGLQTIFAQGALISTYIINVWILKNPLCGAQHLLLGLFVGVQIGSGVFVSGDGLFAIDGLSTSKTILWSSVFLMNAVAGSISDNLCEALMDVTRKKPSEILNSDAPIGSVNDDTAPLDAALHADSMMGDYNKIDYVIALNVVCTLWMLFFCFVPLFAVACLSYEGDTFRRVFLDWSSFSSPSGQAYIFLSDISTVFFGISSLYTFMRIDCVFVEMITAVSNVGQVAIFNEESIVGPVYYSPLDAPLWEVNICVAVLSVLYAVAPSAGRYLRRRDNAHVEEEEDKNDRILESSIGRFYLAAIEGGDFFPATYSEIEDVTSVIA